jgi:DNA-binding transcriptional LysR family regulator
MVARTLGAAPRPHKTKGDLIDWQPRVANDGHKAMSKGRSLEMFVKVAQRGSYRRAAADLGVSPQAVSKGVEALERELKLWLFRRTTRRLSLTDDGRRLLPLASQALEGLSTFFDAAAPADDEVTGPVRIAAPLAIGRDIVAPLVIELVRAHPQLEPELVLQDPLSDVVADRIDVGVRAGKPDDNRLIVQAVAPVQLMVCASPDYLARHGAPATWDDLRQHRLTGYRRTSTGKMVPWERAKGGGEVRYDSLRPCFAANEVSTELQAVLAGVGIGQLASFSAVPHLRRGELCLLFPESITAQYEIYVYRPRRERTPARVRATLDWLVQRLTNHPGLALSAADIAAFARRPLPAAAARRTRPRPPT